MDEKQAQAAGTPTAHRLMDVAVFWNYGKCGVFPYRYSLKYSPRRHSEASAVACSRRCPQKAVYLRCQAYTGIRIVQRRLYYVL